MKNLVMLLCLICYSSILDAQSFYEFQYTTFQGDKPIPCKAFLVKNEDGSGFVRIKYKALDDGQEVLLQMSLVDEYQLNTDGTIDTNVVFVKTIQAESMSDKFEPNPELPVYGFIYNPESGEYEPRLHMNVWQTGVRVTNGRANFTATSLELKDLNRKFLNNYFNEHDDFVINVLQPVTRSVSAAERNIKLHLIIVANTNDKDIGSSCAKDITRMVETFTDLVNYMGMQTLTPKIISGQGYSKKAVQKTISDLKPAANDIVVFYYSGHGFRNMHEKRKYPYMDLRSNTSQDHIKEAMNIEDVFTEVKKKGARCNLVLSDCCNNEVHFTNAKGSKPVKTKTKGKLPFRESNIRELFFNNEQVNILATAADTNQRASSNDQFGGFFSYYFKTALEKRCSILSSTPSWYQVLADAKESTIYKAKYTYCDKPFIPANICEQVPQKIIE